VRVDPRHAFYWHAFFLAVTTSFTEVNTVMPALVLEAGGTAATVGLLTAIMLGLPLVTQLVFAGFLHTRDRKKPFLLLAINLRVLALAGAAVAIAVLGTSAGIIPAVLVAMTVFAVSGAFAGVSYTEFLGSLVRGDQRSAFFVRRQVVTTLGLLVSALVTRFLLGATEFPRGYALLFGLASGVLLVASLGFWALHDPGRPARDDPTSPREGMLAALRQAPGILRGDANLRVLVLVMNLVALGFTSIPLVTALAVRRYELTQATVGTFVLVQIVGMLLAAPLWTRVIRRGGYRLLLTVELGLSAALFPAALVLSSTAPVMGFGALYLVTGAIVSAHRISIDGALVQISPDGRRALYAGIFGAANLASAILPLVTGVLVSTFGYAPVFLAAAVAALAAVVPVRRLDCGDWYRAP
jgi:MFS family permease